MLAYISRMPNIKSDILFLGLLFGVLLVTFSTIGLKVEAKLFRRKTIFTVIFGSLAMGFGVFLLGVVLALPIIGFENIDAAISNYAGLIWLGLAIIMSPVTAKYIK